MTDHLTAEEEPVCRAWQRLVQTALVLFLAITAGILARYWVTPASDGMQQQISRLTAQVGQLEQEQAMPAQVLNRYRDSICYIFGIYQVGFPNQRPAQR